MTTRFINQNDSDSAIDQGFRQAHVADSKEVDALLTTIICPAFDVHRKPKAGLLESAYAACLRHELL